MRHRRRIFIPSIQLYFLPRHSVQSVAGTCLVLERGIQSPINAIASVFAILQNTTSCIHFDYDLLVEIDQQVELNSIGVASGLRQYSYQTCTQLGWHHTSDSPNQPFGSSFPLDIFHTACEDVFGSVFSNYTAHQTSDRLNVAHGGLQPAVTNVVFTHGELDPWRTIGVQEDLNDSSPAIVIAGASQAQDLSALSENDSQELQDAKLRIKAQIQYWIRHAQGIEIVPL